jgi:hypothetical protein
MKEHRRKGRDRDKQEQIKKEKRKEHAKIENEE